MAAINANNPVGLGIASFFLCMPITMTYYWYIGMMPFQGPQAGLSNVDPDFIQNNIDLAHFEDLCKRISDIASRVAEVDDRFNKKFEKYAAHEGILCPEDLLGLLKNRVDAMELIYRDVIANKNMINNVVNKAGRSLFEPEFHSMVDQLWECYSKGWADLCSLRRDILTAYNNMNSSIKSSENIMDWMYRINDDFPKKSMPSLSPIYLGVKDLTAQYFDDKHSVFVLKTLCDLAQLSHEALNKLPITLTLADIGDRLSLLK